MMPTSPEYTIVVPSRARPGSVPKVLRLLPTAVVCIDDRERDDYAAVTPASQLLLHPPTETIGEVRQWILDEIPGPVVMIDDDLRDVRPMVGVKRKPITDPDVIRVIIENGVRCATDLGLHLFSWNRNPVPMYFQPNNPIEFAGPCAGAFGVIGRKFRFDTSLIHGEDCDLTMQALLRDRVVLIDNRFYWQFGPVHQGEGGLQQIRTHEKIKADIDKLRKRWGSYLVLDAKPGSQAHRKRSRALSMSIRVKRN
jgi:hypothetical protein